MAHAAARETSPDYEAEYAEACATADAAARAHAAALEALAALERAEQYGEADAQARVVYLALQESQRAERRKRIFGKRVAPVDERDAARALYDTLFALGTEIDFRGDDLLVPVTAATSAALVTYLYRGSVSTFRSRIDLQTWYCIPLAYQPHGARIP